MACALEVATNLVNGQRVLTCLLAYCVFHFLTQMYLDILGNLLESGRFLPVRPLRVKCCQGRERIVFLICLTEAMVEEDVSEMSLLRSRHGNRIET